MFTVLVTSGVVSPRHNFFPCSSCGIICCGCVANDILHCDGCCTKIPGHIVNSGQVIWCHGTCKGHFVRCRGAHKAAQTVAIFLFRVGRGITFFVYGVRPMSTCKTHSHVISTATQQEDRQAVKIPMRRKLAPQHQAPPTTQNFGALSGFVGICGICGDFQERS